MSAPRTTTCTTCGADIFFAWTLNGKHMPFDAAPIDGPVQGAYRVDDAHIATAAAPMFDEHPGPWFLNHWSTCKAPDMHRSKS